MHLGADVEIDENVQVFGDTFEVANQFGDPAAAFRAART